MTSSADPDYATIGGLLLAPDQIDAVTPWLRPEDFARPLCGELYELILDMHARLVPVDPVTVLSELRSNGRVRADGYPAGELVTMVDAVPVPQAAPYYARIVLAAAVFRRIDDCGAQLRQVGRHARGTPDDAFDIVAGSWQKLAETRLRWRDASGPAPGQQDPGFDHTSQRVLDRANSLPTPDRRLCR